MREPQRGDFQNAAKFCQAQRDFLGEAAFADRYGTNRNKANAFGKCVSQNRILGLAARLLAWTGYIGREPLRQNARGGCDGRDRGPREARDQARSTSSTSAYDVWPRGDRPRRDPGARRRASASASRRPTTACARCGRSTSRRPPTRSTFAFHGAARSLNPYINIVNRLVIVQFEDFDGALRTLAWEPTIAEGAAEAPFYDQLLKRYGEFLSYKVFAKFYNTVAEAVAAVRASRRPTSTT